MGRWRGALSIATVAALVNVASCSDEPEAIIDVVVSEVEPGLPARPDRMTLVVSYRDATGDHEALTQAIEVSPDAMPLVPWAVRVRPLDASHVGRVLYRFTVVAMRAGRAYVTKEQQLVFLARTRLVLPIRLEAACVEQTCDPESTCGGGICGATYVNACTLIEGTRPRACDEGTSAVPMAAGHNHVCAGRNDGTVWCWGMNSAAQLGDLRLDHSMCGDLDCAAPLVATAASDATALSAGALHTCALTRQHTVSCWGDATFGQLGDGSSTHGNVCIADDRITTCSVEPRLVAGLTRVAQIVSGLGHVCARLDDGAVWCWGLDDRGQLGDGPGSPDTCVSGAMEMGLPRPCSRAPVRVVGLDDASSIVAGRKHTCAIRRGGGVLCWGDDGSAQLGDGEGSSATCDERGAPCAESPVIVEGLTGPIALSAGAFHTCALHANGTASCWGSHLKGQLGIGSVLPMDLYLVHTPEVVPELSGIAQIAAGDESTCARLADATVRCWGSNERGQLGNGELPTSSRSPVAVLDLAGVVDLVSGERFSCARLGADVLRCWGANVGMQLADGTTAARGSPVDVQW